MIPGGWNMQREASNNQQDPGFVKGTQEEGLFPGGWNSQIETNNKEQYPRPVQSAMKKKEIFLGDRLAPTQSQICSFCKSAW